MSTKLHKDGDRMAVQTDAKDESTFIREFSELLEKVIQSGTYHNDWAFQLEHWLPQAFEILLHYRGYKNDTQIKAVIVSGDAEPGRIVAENSLEFGPRCFEIDLGKFEMKKDAGGSDPVSITEKESL